MKKFFKGLAASLLAGVALLTVAGCGEQATPEKPEEPKLEWHRDSSQHWHENAEGEMFDVSAHNYFEWTVAKEPTYDEAGARVRTCKDCGFVYKEVIARKQRTFETVGLGEGKELTINEGTTYVKLPANTPFTIKSVDDIVFNADNIKTADEYKNEDKTLKVAKEATYEFKVEYDHLHGLRVSFAEFNPVQYYVKGGMNGWGVNDAYKVENDINTMSATLTCEISKDVEFKIADADWKHEFNFNTTELDKTCFAAAGSNIKCIKTGTYKVTISGINTDKPQCKIEFVK